MPLFHITLFFETPCTKTANFDRLYDSVELEFRRKKFYYNDDPVLYYDNGFGYAVDGWMPMGKSYKPTIQVK